MTHVKDLSDIRPVGTGMTVANWEAKRQQHIYDGIWACPCGSRKFHLIQSAENVKAVCAKCENADILYWNGNTDPSKGRMRRLDTGAWVGPGNQ